MNRAWTLLGGLGLGAGAIYLLDPDSGARRRALIRDQAVRAAHLTRDFVGKAGRNLGSRMKGTLAQTAGAVENRLKAHRCNENIPALQGGARPAGDPTEWAQRNWTPRMRLMAGIAGAAAMAFALGRRRTPQAVEVKAPSGPQRSPRHSRYL